MFSISLPATILNIAPLLPMIRRWSTFVYPRCICCWLLSRRVSITTSSNWTRSDASAYREARGFSAVRRFFFFFHWIAVSPSSSAVPAILRLLRGRVDLHMYDTRVCIWGKGQIICVNTKSSLCEYVCTCVWKEYIYYCAQMVSSVFLPSLGVRCMGLTEFCSNTWVTVTAGLPL